MNEEKEGRKEGREEGREEGRKEGRKEGREGGKHLKHFIMPVSRYKIFCSSS